MDTKKEIDKLIELLPDELRSRITSGVYQHIERSEYHFSQAKTKKDDQYFTDAIYRTNQAYEGILRETYEVLSKQKSDELTTYKIEEYFANNNILNARVRNIFINYRKEWRNPATHNHNLFFKVDEAFLAIVNVSAFIFILLNQIIEKVAYADVKEEISKNEPLVRKELLKTNKDIVTVLSTAFLGFAEYSLTNSVNFKTESQLMGSLIAFLEEILDGYKLTADYEVLSNRVYCDLLIQKDNYEPVIIELKNRYDERNETIGTNQVVSYLIQSGFTHGIIYFASDKKNIEYKIQKKIFGEKTVLLFIPQVTKSLTTAST